MKAEATILASFASSLSWQTYKALKESGTQALGDAEIKNEYKLAKEKHWKQIRNTDIQEVASMNVGESAFFAWLYSNVEKNEQKVYKEAWKYLLQEFAQECDDISNGKQ